MGYVCACFCTPQAAVREARAGESLQVNITTAQRAEEVPKSMRFVFGTSRDERI